MVKHCGRTAPAVIKGIPAAASNGTAAGAGSGSAGRPVLVLPANGGFQGPAVLLENPINDNINMNQIFAGVDIEIELGNPDAIGISARGAQGVRSAFCRGTRVWHRGAVLGCSTELRSAFGVTARLGGCALFPGRGLPSPTLTERCPVLV